MMGFDSGEIARSLLWAIIYGAGYSFVLYLLSMLFGLLGSVRDASIKIIRFEKLFPLPSFSEFKISCHSSWGFTVFSVFLFATGFSLLSYLSLDGEIRIYMLILSFASFYLSKIAFSVIFSHLFAIAFRFFLVLISLPVRIILLLLLYFPRRICRGKRKNS